MGPASAPGFIEFHLWKNVQRNISRAYRHRYFKGLKFLNMHYKCAGWDHVRWLIVSNVLNLFLDLSWHLLCSPRVIKFEWGMAAAVCRWPPTPDSFQALISSFSLPKPFFSYFLCSATLGSEPVWCGVARQRLCSNGYQGDAERVTLLFYKGLIDWDRKRRRRRRRGSVMVEGSRSDREMCVSVCVMFSRALGSQ